MGGVEKYIFTKLKFDNTVCVAPAELARFPLKRFITSLELSKTVGLFHAPTLQAYISMIQHACQHL